MDAKTYNQAMTKLFFGGDPVAMMMRNGLRQLDEMVQEERYLRRLRAAEWYSHELPCPCGCGQVGVCDAQLALVATADEEIPF